MKERNLAYELLKNSSTTRLRATAEEHNAGKKYSELMQSMVNSYLNGQLTNAEVFEEMLKMAKEMLSENQKAKELGLSEEELRFTRR
ncbi:MAG: type I restriction enzyme endonuclease domain-containing protein [Collinsella sp.]